MFQPLSHLAQIFTYFNMKSQRNGTSSGPLPYRSLTLSPHAITSRRKQTNDPGAAKSLRGSPPHIHPGCAMQNFALFEYMSFSSSSTVSQSPGVVKYLVMKNTRSPQTKVLLNNLLHHHCQLCSLHQQVQIQKFLKMSPYLVTKGHVLVTLGCLGPSPFRRSYRTVF